MGRAGNSIFIFRRDLRLQDNTGLMEALSSSDRVLPCFILDPAQSVKNPYKGSNSLQFMLRSLGSLDASLRGKGARLHLSKGDPVSVLSSLLDEGFDAIYHNRDHTPFSRRRDCAIEGLCRRKGASYASFDDALLLPPDSVLSSKGSAFKVFSAFLRKALTSPVRAPRANARRNYMVRDGSLMLEDAASALLRERNPDIRVEGGREEALGLLAGIRGIRDYGRARQFPAMDATTHLSAHNKFGTISIREFYHAIPKTEGFFDLKRELYWRDFFTYVAFHNPHVFQGPFDRRFGSIPWSDDKRNLKAWQDGRTGFPIVDAGMRQLKATGYMHNRVRMIVSSFLVKDLHIDWRLGERHFAHLLVDYDPSVNNGNWQWAASTGCDAQPYFRIFNPWRQQERFDPDCLYIKRWVPELEGLSPSQIHALRDDDPPPGYPKQIVEHGIESALSRRIFADAAGRSKLGGNG